MNRLTTEKYSWALRTEYYRNAKRKPNGQRHERFGQWVWNTYGKPHLTWPELFYQEDEVRVLDLLDENQTEAAGSC